MADTGHDDATPKPYGASPELVRTMIGSAPLFEAERGDRSTTILPAFDASHDARKLVREAQRELDATQDHPREAARLNHDVALVFDERLDDFHRGLLSYQRAQELDPTNRAYMSAARVCYRQRENWTMTLALLDAELDVVSDPVERGRLLFDKGLIFEEWLSHGAMAQKLYEEALAAVPGDLEVLHQLRRLLMQRGDPQGRLEVCRRAIAATTDRRQRSLLYAEVARIQLEVLNDEEQALESYAVAFVEDPANSAVSDAVLRLNSRRGRLGEVVDILLTTGDLAENEEGRRTRYLTAARICRDRLGQSDRALELLERVQYEDLDRQTGREMAELLGAAGRMEELLQLYTKHLDPTVGASAALLHYRVAELLARHLRRKDEARVHYLRALAADPSFLAARHALECSYHEAKDASGLLELRRGELRSIGDPVEQAFQLTRLALLCAEHLGDLEEATDLLKRALITVDGFAPARRELVLIYERGGAHKPLAALLEQEIEIQGLELAPLPLLRLAELAEREFLDLERAAKLYRRALDQAPRQISILRSLERLYALLGKHEERLELLEREGELARDPHLKRHLASRAAQLCDEVLGRSDEAEKRYRAILEEYPLDRGVLASVVRLCEARGGTGELVAIYRGQLDHGEAVAPSWRAMLHCRSGQILEEFLGQPEAAIDEFEHVLVDDPKNGYALAEIARLQRAAGRWDELYETLRRQAAHAEDPDDRASVLLSAGDLALHRRDDANLALTCYREALEAQPDHAAARDAALGILFAEGRYAEATVILEDALGQTSNGRQRLILLKRLGALWSEELGDERRAVAILHEGLGIDANDVELLAGLDRLYRRLHDDEGIVANAERLASASEDRHECLRYLYEAVRVVEARLVDTRDPAVLYQEILAHAPTDKRALFALARLHTQRDEPDALKKVYEALVQEETNEDRRRQILLRLASVRERLDDLSGAVSALVEVKGSNDWFVQRELRRLYELLGQWEDVARAHEAEAAVSRHADHVADSLLAAAHLYQERLNDPDRAIAVLRRILMRVPFHERAANHLEQLLVQREGWQELVDVFRARLEVAEDGEFPGGGSAVQARIEILLRMSWIQREHLQQPSEAVATLKEASRLDPHHLSTLLTLAELQVALGQHAEAVGTLEQVVALSDDPDILLRTHFQLGERFQDDLDEPQRAISSFQNVLAISSKDREALDRLHRLFRATGDWDNAAEVIKRSLELERDPARQSILHVAFAEIAEEGFEDLQQAADHYSDALEIDPSNEHVIGRLIDILGKLGRWEHIPTTLRSYLAGLPEDRQNEAIGWRMRLADVLHRHLARSEEALEQYQAVIEIDPTDVRARLASGRLFAEAGRVSEAVAQHREILEIDPLHRESLGQLRAIWARAGAKEQASAAAALLVVTGLADESERRLYREHRTLGVRAPQLALDPGLYNDTLLHPAEQHPSRAILNVLCEAAHRIRPPDFDHWQVSKSDRLSPRSDDPIKALVQQAHTCLGLVRDVEIYISHVRSREMGLLLTDPPSLVVGGGVMASFPSRQVRFWITRLLTYVRNRTWVAHGLRGKGLGTLVLAAQRLIDPQAAGTGIDETEILEMSRLVQRGLGRRGRRTLDEVVRGLRDVRPPAYGEWALGMELTALRTALWAVNDLEAALEHLRHLDPKFAQATHPEKFQVALRGDRLASEVLRFWLSDELLSARHASQV